ncbi:hypothetical protein BgAZ_300110 [Babesia gibsoni]|uniref:EF-hand domain-containing protein n=1 Tax=Babesia gibsoni TaxID=33632 RepID=A0AAD8LN66_BABGI|nr:hypothetical protein BgAZ_300110 [Babesia gibsoni]
MASTNKLDPLTRQIVNEITDIFALNCIKPWQLKNADDEPIGTIRAQEFVGVARQLGCVFTASESRALSRQFRKHGLNYINVDQFLQLIDNKIKHDHFTAKCEPFTTPNDIIRPKLEQLYDVLDYQKQNKLTLADIKHFLGCINDGELSNKDIEELLKTSKVKLKRNLTKEEFVQIFCPVEDTSYLSLKVLHR